MLPTLLANIHTLPSCHLRISWCGNLLLWEHPFPANLPSNCDNLLPVLWKGRDPYLLLYLRRRLLTGVPLGDPVLHLGAGYQWINLYCWNWADTSIWITACILEVNWNTDVSMTQCNLYIHNCVHSVPYPLSLSGLWSSQHCLYWYWLDSACPLVHGLVYHALSYPSLGTGTVCLTFISAHGYGFDLPSLLLHAWLISYPSRSAFSRSPGWPGSTDHLLCPLP